MDLKIAQGFDYKGHDHWDWWVWVEGEDEDLDQIDHVTYILHHTFPNPVRKVKTRADKFLLKTAGWGCFVIHAKVKLKTGEESHLTHELELRYPDGTVTTA
jgi:transcription initiation factor IIF auxiliary subunit